MQQKIEIDAQKRNILGRKVKSLRSSGYMPGILYGKGQESIPLQVNEKIFSNVLKEAGESTLVYLNLDGQAYPTIIHDVTKDPVTDNVIHADFYKVRLDQKIKTDVPIVFEGESPAVKDLRGIFITNIHELEVEALPQDLPHEVRIDISALKEFDDHVTVKDVKIGFGEKVRLTADDSLIIATVQEPKSQEELDKELAEPTTDVSEVQVGEEKKEEGEEGDKEESASGREKEPAGEPREEK